MPDNGHGDVVTAGWFVNAWHHKSGIRHYDHKNSYSKYTGLGDPGNHSNSLDA